MPWNAGSGSVRYMATRVSRHSGIPGIADTILPVTALAPAVFMDRDGTLIEEAGYLDSLDRLTLFPSTVDALRLLGRAGFRLVVVTNQSGIALGLFDEPFVRGTHDALHARLDAAGARIDGWYFCPHHPAGQVRGADDDLRLPQAGAGAGAPGRRRSRHRSGTIVDDWRPMGRRRSWQPTPAWPAGSSCVPATAAAPKRARPGVHAAFVADDVMDAAGWILRQGR